MPAADALQLEQLLRLGSFLAVFAALAAWEWLAPRRDRTFARRARWPHNVGLLVVDVVVLRIAAPGAAIAVALAGEARGWGLVNCRRAVRLGGRAARGRRCSISRSTSST